MAVDTLKKIIDNPIPYAHALGMTKLREDIHKEWIQNMFHLNKNDTLQAHRGSYKTTCLRVAIGLRIIAKPHSNLILQRKSDADVKDIINAVSKDLKSDLCMSLMKDIYGQYPTFTADNNSEIELSTYKGVMGRQLIGMGIGSSITGKHATVITDDIVTLKDRISGAERERTKAQVMELVNIASEDDMFIFNSGTPWHKNDAFELMPIPKKYTWRETGIITPERIEEIKDMMSPSLFAANYELKHVADGDVLFNEPDYGAYPEKVVSYGQLDAAYGGSDSNGLTIGCEVDNRVYIIGRKYQGHVENHYNAIIKMLESHNVVECYLEDNADKGFLRKELQKRTHIKFIGYHEKMNKYYKISSYGKSVWNRVTIDIDKSDYEYISEILDYNEDAEHDDCPDSFASLVRRKFFRRKVASYH